MKKRFKRVFALLFVVLPLVFSMVFFGYLPPKFDIVLHTDNIVGEGICMTYLSSRQPFSPFYQAGVYFGSILQKATVYNIHYDVKELSLTISDVSEADIESYDLVIMGRTVASYDLTGRVAPGEYDGLTVSVPEDGTGMHLVFDDPNVGAAISLATHFAPWWYWTAYALLVVGISALLALGLSFAIERFPAMLSPVLTASALTVTLLAGGYFCGSFPYIKYTDFLLNWLFLFAAALLINGLTLPWLGTVAVMIFTTGWYIANYYVIIFRNKPIMPADLKAIGTAAEVMGGYTFVISIKMILGVLAVAGFAIAVVSINRKRLKQARPTRKRALIRRGISIAAAALLMVLGVNTNTFKSLNSFAWDAVLLKSFHQEGMVLTYLKSALNSGIKKPEGYSRELVDGYLDDYPAEAAEGVRPTNIIMVMNEAFADLRTVGLDENIDVMPFIDSLDENVIEGSLYVSIFGGGTCNTEFEGLTGNTLAFLGTGAYPYTENVTAPLFSLAQYFGDAGYITEAFHANEAHNWNRNMVYPNLGFEAFHSIMDYAQALGDFPYLHGHPADMADYAYIEKTEAEHAGQPTFLFNVTMQNHSGYERWEDVEKAASVEEFGSEYYPDTQVYLSLVKASDDAVKQLVETYRDSDEPTMIIFFGDHQPGLPAIAQREFYRNVDSYLDWYKSKFFIWTNYGTETAHDVEISANYLPWLILERGHFPLPPYVQMLREVHEQYPVISAMGVIDAEGNEYGSVNELPDDPLIQKYRNIQYANMFDAIDEAWFQVK